MAAPVAAPAAAAPMPRPRGPILSLAFSRAARHLAVGTTTGYQVFQAAPIGPCMRRSPDWRTDATDRLDPALAASSVSQPATGDDGGAAAATAIPPRPPMPPLPSKPSLPLDARNPIAHVHLIDAANLVVFVGALDPPTGRQPASTPAGVPADVWWDTHTVVIWDDAQNRDVARFHLKAPVHAVAATDRAILVGTRGRIDVFGLWPRPHWRYGFDVDPDARGADAVWVPSAAATATATVTATTAAATSPTPGHVVMAFPSRTSGQLAIVSDPQFLPPAAADTHTPVAVPSEFERRGTAGAPPGEMVAAHHAAIAIVRIAASGTLLATASARGTLIRLFSTQAGAASRAWTCLRELRRGVETAAIQSLAFSPAATMLAVASDTGTVHLFRLTAPPAAGSSTRDDAPPPSSLLAAPAAGGGGGDGDGSGSGNRVSRLSPLRGLVPRLIPAYFASEWSAAQYTLPRDAVAQIAFLPSGRFLVAAADGTLACFQPVGTDLQLLSFQRFLRPEHA
ncbi:hypothetical protein CXG81DRAFT_28577 [Caulochytrium protostelioides]|uniref:WD40 repeat-like protein n=1 Tax=Caulochytrium protostelioides TaxID=1555241 RepID=A0A4P9X0T1_9FUNG|nr:hypothetical protein CXG81DRAFT_28577 [Caulochytrium protostelioides]|eukprot:RKO98612.1 hypothetical protein CXG81DRAFT_28577 [Caulochytrium protostelioides]